MSDVYEELQPLMFSIAYRMLGSATEAEDIVQEAFLRFHRETSGGTQVDSPKAYLSAVTTRLSIDHLRSARIRRERYVGTWLPEPLLTDEADDVARHAETADSLSMGFLVLLESLTPVERAVFLLREVFEYDFDEIAGIVGKTEENCRQISVRARRHVRRQAALRRVARPERGAGAAVLRGGRRRRPGWPRRDARGRCRRLRRRRREGARLAPSGSREGPGGKGAARRHRGSRTSRDHRSAPRRGQRSTGRSVPRPRRSTRSRCRAGHRGRPHPDDSRGDQPREAPTSRSIGAMRDTTFGRRNGSNDTSRQEVHSMTTLPADISLRDLRAAVTGLVIGPDDDGYDGARAVFPGGIDHRPAAIVRVADATDVARVVAFARSSGAELAVRSGGHSGAGHGVSDGGIVIDLRGMRRSRSTTSSRTAWARDGPHGGRVHEGRGRARSGDRVRRHRLGGDRRHHAGRRRRLPRAQARAHDRRSARRRDRHGRRGGARTSTPRRIPTCSGRSAAGAETSASPPGSTSGSTSFRPSWAACCCCRRRPRRSWRSSPRPRPRPRSSRRSRRHDRAADAVPPRGGARTARDHGADRASPAMPRRVSRRSRRSARSRLRSRTCSARCRIPESIRLIRRTTTRSRSSRTMFVDEVDDAAAHTILERLEASDAPMRAVQLRVLGGAMARVPNDATAFAHRDRRLMLNVAAFAADPSELPMRTGGWERSPPRSSEDPRPPMWASCSTRDPIACAGRTRETRGNV